MPIDSSPATLITDFPTQTVQVWDEVWVTQRDLYCDSLVTQTNELDVAILRYELGPVLPTGGNAFATNVPLDLIGKFVRVIIAQPDDIDNIVWFGYVTGDAEDRGGVKVESGNNRRQGSTQFFAATDFKYFLTRNPITSAIIYKAGDTPPYVRIERALVMNGGTSSDHDTDIKNRGNQSATSIALDGDEYFLFTDGSDPPLEWKGSESVSHLLKFHGPADKDGNALPFEFKLETDSAIKNIYPKVPTDGKTIFQILGEMCSPARGLCWWVEPFAEDDEGDHEVDGAFPDVVTVRVATLLTDALALPNGETLPGNPDQDSVNFDAQVDIDEVGTLKRDLSRRYHQIIVRGERMTSTFTLGVTDSTLAKDWTDEAELAYKAAASTTLTGYGSLSGDEQEQANDAARRDEKHYRVYSAFRIPITWDGKTGDGSTATKHFAIPLLSSTGSILGGKPISVFGLRFKHKTRLIRGANYHDLTSVVDPTPPRTEPDYLPPFGIALVATGTPDRYQYIDKLNDCDFPGSTPLTDGEVSGSYHVSSQENVPGILLQASGGLSHTAALNWWDGAEPSGTEPEIDYSDMRFTVTAEADGYCESRFPLDADLPAGVSIERIKIDAGEQYRLDYLAVNTVVGLVDGVPILAIGGIIRDDRNLTDTIAHTAWQWYGIERRPLSVTFKNIKNVFRLGLLITTIGDGTTAVNVNSVVNRIAYTYRQDVENPAASMTVSTHSDELHFAQLIS